MRNLSPEAKRTLFNIMKYFADMYRTGSATAVSYWQNSSSESMQKEYQDEGNRDAERNKLTEYMANCYRKQGPVNMAIDFGCGNGSSAVVLDEVLHPQKLILIDSQPIALELARTQVENAGINCSLEYLLGNESLLRAGLPQTDLLFMRGVVKYVENRQNLFSAAHTSLAKGGVFLFDVPIKAPGDWIAIEHSPINYFAKILADSYGLNELVSASKEENSGVLLGTVRRELQAAGFRNVELYHPRMVAQLQGVMYNAGMFFDYAIVRNVEKNEGSRGIEAEIMELKQELLFELEKRLILENPRGLFPISQTIYRAQK